MSSVEDLNNAIVRLAQLAGPRSKSEPLTSTWRTAARELNYDWQNWWDDSLARSIGPIGVAFVFGVQQGFWERYALLYEHLPPNLQAQLQQPGPIAPAPVDDAMASAIDANRSVVSSAADAAKSGADAVRETAQNLADISERAAEGTKSVLTRVAIAAGAIALVLFLARQR